MSDIVRIAGGHDREATSTATHAGSTLLEAASRAGICAHSTDGRRRSECKEKECQFLARTCLVGIELLKTLRMIVLSGYLACAHQSVMTDSEVFDVAKLELYDHGGSPYVQYASRLGLWLALLVPVKKCLKSESLARPFRDDLGTAIDRFEHDLKGSKPKQGPHGLGGQAVEAREIESAKGSVFRLLPDDWNALRGIFKEVASDFTEDFTSEDMLNGAMERVRGATRKDAPLLKKLHDAFDAASKREHYYDVSGELCKKRAEALTNAEVDDRWHITCPVMKQSELRTWLVRLHWAIQDVVRKLVEFGCSDDKYYEKCGASRAGTRVRSQLPAP